MTLDSCWVNLWQACWQGGLVVVIVWAICRLAPAIPARCQCWLWRLAMLKFVVVLLLPTLVTLPVLPTRIVTTRMAVRQIVATRPSAPSGDSVPPATAELPPPPDFASILRCLWLGGIGLSLLRLSLAWNSARRLTRRCSMIAEGPLFETLQAQTRLFGPRTVPRLAELPGGGSPRLLGMFRPTILIPADTQSSMSDTEQAMVLGHELAHIRRGDLFWCLIASLVRSVFFFHPLAWFCEWQLKLAQEMAADELAIVKQDTDPIEYGRSLVSVLGKFGTKMGSGPLVSAISLETAGPIRSLTRRLVAMSRIGRRSRWILVGSGFLLGLFVVLGLVPWRLAAMEAKQLPHVYQAQIRVGEGKDGQSELQISSPTLGQGSTEGQRFYQAHIRFSEGRKDQPEVQSSAPTLGYASGQGAVASSLFQNDKTRLWVMALSAPAEGKPEEHTMQVTLLHNPSGKELTKEEQDGLVKMLYKTFLTQSAWKMSKGSQIRVAMPDGYATIQCDADAKAVTDGLQKIPECVLWRSPELTFACGATSKIVMPRNDGSQFTIEVTVSPVEGPKDNAPELKAQSWRGDDAVSRHLRDAKEENLTLADYETVPSPKNAHFGKRPYRMDSDSFGIVVVDDEKGNTHVAGVNKQTGQWKWLEMPNNDELAFEPIMGEQVVAFIQHGQPLTRLVVYNGPLNKWSTFPLEGRVIDVLPCVGDRMVGYQLSDRVVAYSATRDAWGMLRTEATLMVDEDNVFVDTPDGRFAFPDKNSGWSRVNPTTTASR